MAEDKNAKIYLLPNLMTAGNLFCGFTAVLRIYDGAQDVDFTMAAHKFHDAIWFILAACIFDLLDGRLARLGGHESAFGREFDSLADVISFGMAPALLVYQIVLGEFRNLGWMIAFVLQPVYPVPESTASLGRLVTDAFKKSRFILAMTSM